METVGHTSEEFNGAGSFLFDEACTADNNGTAQEGPGGGPNTQCVQLRLWTVITFL